MTFCTCIDSRVDSSAVGACAKVLGDQKNGNRIMSYTIIHKFGIWREKWFVKQSLGLSRGWPVPYKGQPLIVACCCWWTHGSAVYYVQWGQGDNQCHMLPGDARS